MRKQDMLLGVLAFAAALFVAGCGNSDSTTQQESQVSGKDVEKTVKEAVEVTKDFTENKFDEYSKSIEMKIDAIELKHEELSMHAKQASEEVNAKLHDTLLSLEKKKEGLHQQLEELKSASGKALEDLKTGIEQALVELDESYDAALTRFSKG